MQAALAVAAAVLAASPGRADRLAPDDLANKKVGGYVTGLPWNLATVGTLDYGVSSEDTGLHVNFNHIF